MSNFKPNTITDAEAEVIIAKFQKLNKGVIIGSPYLTNSGSRNYDAVSSKWADLIDSHQCSITNLKQKMLEIYNKINNFPEDEVLGDISVHYTVSVEERGRTKRVPIHWSDEYILLREAVREQQASKEYKALAKELEETEKFIEENKPKDQVLKSKEERAASLRAKLGMNDESTQEASVAKAPAAPVAA